MNQKQVIELIDKYNKKAKLNSRKCLFHDCENTSISSHLLQKRGVISQIAKNNHVWELGIDSFKTKSFYLKKTGVNDAFSFLGFCKIHDDGLFKDIETGPLDYFDYRTQLLFSYRAAMNEKRKKEILVDFFNKILNSFELKLYLPEGYFDNIRESKQGELAGIQDEIYFENYFISNINDRTKSDFKFFTVELPKVELCSSAVFTYETSQEIEYITRFKSYMLSKPLTSIYVNFLPTESKNILILGCLLERFESCREFLEGFNTKDSNKTFMKLSDLLLCQVENWLCSYDFYSKHLKARENEIVYIVHESLQHSNERRELGINLFKSVN